MEQSIPLERRSLARLDPARVRRALGRAAPVEPDDLLAAIDTQLLERIDEIRITPQRILELGRVPGRCARALQQRFPKARVVSAALALPVQPLTSPWRLPWRSHPVASCVNPNALPFVTDHFDLVVSNMMLHWSSDPATTLKETLRVLSPGAPLLLATLGEESLTELRTILAELDQLRLGRIWPRVPAFPALPELGDLLAHAGFSMPVVDRDRFQSLFADADALLHHLRRMGATNAHRQRPAGLMGKGYLRQLHEQYHRQYATEENAIPVTLELLFGHAWKKNATPGQTAIPPSFANPTRCHA